jgi:PKD repeat protein
VVAGESGNTLDITATADVQVIAVLSSPGCTNDSSNVISTTVITNDNVCNAFPLEIGNNGAYSTDGATVETDEVVAPAGTCEDMSSWCNSNLDATVWFTFEAPASGHMSINTPGFDTQIAVWEVGDCSDFTTFTLVTANDDDSSYTMHGGAQYSSFINGAYCLTPGATYYLQLDAYSGTGTTDIILADPGASAPVAVSLTDSAYCGSSIVVDAGTFASYDWSTGDTTQTITYSGSGTGIVSVTVTDEFGCTGSDTATYTSIEPMAGFTTTQALNVVNATSTSTPAGGDYGTTYDWTFGDGGTGTGETPSHTYPANGTYTITLVVTNSCGDDTLTQNVTITGVSVFDVTGNTVLNVYPNPATEIVNVMGKEAIVSMQLVNAAGQVVVNNANVNSTNATIDVSAFERGTYVLNVNTVSGHYTVNISVVK